MTFVVVVNCKREKLLPEPFLFMCMEQKISTLCMVSRLLEKLATGTAWPLALWPMANPYLRSLNSNGSESMLANYKQLSLKAQHVNWTMHKTIQSQSLSDFYYLVITMCRDQLNCPKTYSSDATLVCYIHLQMRLVMSEKVAIGGVWESARL